MNVYRSRPRRRRSRPCTRSGRPRRWPTPRTESVAFAGNYAAFRQTIEDRMSQLEKRRFAPPDFAARPDVVAWKKIADEVMT